VFRNIHSLFNTTRHLINTAILDLFVTFSAAAENQPTPKPNSPAILQMN
jgi:hypothetical protein